MRRSSSLLRASLVAACAWLCAGASPALASTGGISGHVSDAVSHAKLDNIEVDAYDSSGGVFDSTCTSSTGTYSISALPPGTYNVGFLDTDDGSAGCTT